MTENEQRSFHIDKGQIFRTEKTPEGFLNCHARVAKVGELRYINPDGSDRIERVTPEVLFNADSYNSLKMKPVTCPEHPPVMLDSSNAQDYTKGFTSNIVTIDGSFLGVCLTLTDQVSIDAVESGEIREVSCGYMATTKLLPDGTFQQLSRDYNHLAIVSKGRAGRDVKISMDSEDLPVTVLNEDFDINTSPIKSEMTTEIKTTSLKLDEHESIELPIEVANKIKTRFTADADAKADMKAKLDKMKAEYDSLMEKYKSMEESKKEEESEDKKDAKMKCDRCDAISKILSDRKYDSFDALLAKFDSQSELVEELKTAKNDAASIDIPTLVKARVALERKCDGLLPSDFKADEASDRQLMEAVIVKNTKLSNCDGLSDDYVKARFDSVIEVQENKDSSEITRKAANESGTTTNTDSLSEVEKLRLDALEAQKQYLESLTGATK